MASTDLFSAFATGAPSAPPVTATPNPTQTAPRTSDLFSAFTQNSAPVTTPAGGGSAPTQIAPKTSDLFSAFSPGATPTTSSTSETEPEESTTWYGKSWDWLNKPLLDLHRAGA